MALYTKNGDGGFASLPGEGQRVRKDDPRLAALGELDELNAAVGLCLAEAGRTDDASVHDALAAVQAELFRVGAALAAGEEKAPAPFSSAVTRMEQQIDAICAELPELSGFILPGGCELACRLHLARTIARRAERAVVAALNPSEGDKPFDQAHDKPPVVLQYLNRLSDLLFALARLANKNAGVDEKSWKP